jgi:sterol desaturase/sphingolipid hydroxylase (fatty acid hydroxylase superfamily)
MPAELSRDPTVYAIPGFILLLAGEWWLLHRRHRAGTLTRGRPYESRDTWASLAMGGGILVIGAGIKLVQFGFATWLWERHLWDLGTSVWTWVGAVVAFDLAYYWDHRWRHEVRFLWASHVNHHSSQRFNYSTALRQEWSPWLELLLYPLLALVGFRPEMIVVAHGISLIYQFWVHTELVDRCGPLEWVLNTPSHHRVHHGSNQRYLDRNYAGILIVWDRLFGTFEPETEAVRYGLTKDITTYNPLRIASHEYASMLADVRGAASWRARLGYVFRHPGWTPAPAPAPAPAPGAGATASEAVATA